MNIEIRRLTPELADEYVRFFDETPHDTCIDANKCYCVTWRSDAAYTDAGHWFPTREERRERARAYVREGSIRGYLAYCDGEIVGWCNANEDCRMGVDYLRAEWPIEQYPPHVRVRPIFCFVVKPEMQRRGIATRLLERVCADAAAEGFDYVEAYVNDAFTDAAGEFRGPKGMYEKCGFVQYAARGGKAVMRRALKSGDQ